jgi:hypothetical protein
MPDGNVRYKRRMRVSLVLVFALGCSHDRPATAPSASPAPAAERAEVVEGVTVAKTASGYRLSDEQFTVELPDHPTITAATIPAGHIVRLDDFRPRATLTTIAISEVPGMVGDAGELDAMLGAVLLQLKLGATPRTPTTWAGRAALYAEGTTELGGHRWQVRAWVTASPNHHRYYHLSILTAVDPTSDVQPLSKQDADRIAASLQVRD